MAVRQTALGGATLLLTLAAPAAAQAATTVTPSSPCVRYIPGTNTLGLSTAGWAPSTSLSFYVDGQYVGSGTTSAAGAFATAPDQLLQPPLPDRNVQSVTLSAKNPAGTAVTAPMKVVRLGVKVPSRAKPSKRVRYRVYGFVPGKRVYLFVRRGGKTKHRFKLGRAHGACGTLTKRMRYMPLRHWRTGKYQYWYSHSRHYSKKTRVYGYSIRIYRTFKPRTASASAARGW